MRNVIMCCRSWPVAFLAVLVMSLACEPSPKTSVVRAPTTARTGQLVVGVQVGQLAPEIEGDDVDGKRFRLSDYRGKVVALDFWATW
jgi:hypothetical protein